MINTKIREKLAWTLLEGDVVGEAQSGYRGGCPTEGGKLLPIKTRLSIHLSYIYFTSKYCNKSSGWRRIRVTWLRGGIGAREGGDSAAS